MIPLVALDKIIQFALTEDLGSGDLTTEATVPQETVAVGRAHAKAPTVVCGGQVFQRVFHQVDPSVSFEAHAAEGSVADAGSVLWTVRGAAHSLLLGERTALNFVQHMCGVATKARRFVQALPPGSHTRITDTRKTMPGLRSLERYAVRSGGAHNHRDSLGAAVLIKENHIAAAGSITAAIEGARAHAPHTTKIEVEVASLEQVEEALTARADILMLDNFDPAKVARAVAMVNGQALVEVSGGVQLEQIKPLARLGVDAISIGALTHSVEAADISFMIESHGRVTRLSSGP